MKRTKLFSLPTVTAAAPVKPSSRRLSPLRALAGFFVWVLLSGLGSLSPTPSWAATPCGGDGQRACCVGERIPSCNPGLHEVLSCTGDCTCGGFNPLGIKSIGQCAAPPAPATPPPPPTITPCGGYGQRACCVGERSFGACAPPLIEVAGCTGDCTCGGVNPFGIKSSSHCWSATPCGGAGQRACCVIERPGTPCNQGLIEVGGCTGDCTCFGQNPGGLIKSSGRCAAPPPPAAPPTIAHCGAINERACCVSERLPSCDKGLHEVLVCAGNCTCGGLNPGGIIKSIGHCEGGCSEQKISLATLVERKKQIETALVGLNAQLVEMNKMIATQNQHVQRQCSLPWPVECQRERSILADLMVLTKLRETALDRPNAELVTLNRSIAVAQQAVQKQCAQQVAPAVKRDMLIQPVGPALRQPVTK